MSDININITADEEPKVYMNIMETVPVGKYEEKANKKQGMEEVTDFKVQFLSAGAIQKIKEEILKKLNNKEDVSNKIDDMNTPDLPEGAYPTVNAVVQMVEELSTYIELNRNHTYVYDTFEIFMATLENLDGYLASYGKPGEVIIIKEDDFPNLMITNNEVFQGENGNLDKVYALELIKTQGYFEAWGLHFSPLFEEYFTKLEKTENKTLGGNMPVTHPDCTIATDESYPSLRYLKENFDYFKTEYVDDKIGNIKTNKEDVSNKVSDIALATNSVNQYPTVEAVKKYIAEQLANWGGGTNPTPSATSKVENGVLTLIESGNPTLFASINNGVLLISQIGNYYKTTVENQVLTLV